jgi:hypothetical protein
MDIADAFVSIFGHPGACSGPAQLLCASKQIQLLCNQSLCSRCTELMLTSASWGGACASDDSSVMQCGVKSWVAVQVCRLLLILLLLLCTSCDHMWASSALNAAAGPADCGQRQFP